MTVQGEKTSTVSVVDPANAEMFAAQYARYWNTLCGYIALRVDDRHRHQAEDLAQEAVIRVWTQYALTGKLRAWDRLWPLFKLSARSVLGDFYELKSSRDRSLDFADPVNAPVISTGHAYALETPGLSSLVADLAQAMETMTARSTAWRDLHKERYALRAQLADDYMASRGGITDSAKARTQDRLADADREEETALEAFRLACRRVGQLRAEIESEAGANWQSVTGMPVESDTTPFRKGVYRNDRSVTHCPSGHLLDKDNTHFGEDGSRRCRACNAKDNEKQKLARRAQAVRPKRDTIAADAIATARALYLDPTNTLTVAAIAREVGASPATLYRRIPELAARRTGTNPCTRKNSTERTTA